MATKYQMRNETSNLRLDGKQEYTPLVDLFNTLVEIAGYKDVTDNFEEIKLLFKYPKLTPYMYALFNIKQTTFDSLYNIASEEYGFRNKTDFVLSYFKIIHDNFGIYTSSINSIIRKAEKKAKSHKIINELEEKLGKKKGKKIPLGVRIMHFLIYWPIFAVYFVFEVFRVVLTKLDKAAYVVFVLLFIGENIFFPKLFDWYNFLDLRHIIHKESWYLVINNYWGEMPVNWFSSIALSLATIIGLVVAYILPALLFAIFIGTFGDSLCKKYDWIGYKRTFENFLSNCRLRTEKQYKEQKKVFYRVQIPKIILNLICLVTLIAIIYYVPIGVHYFSEKTGYGQKVKQKYNSSEYVTHKKNEDKKVEYNENIAEIPELVIVVDTANIRAGVGTDFNVVATGVKGETFVGTGNEEIDSNSEIWYEVYIDNEKIVTGWASQKVIEKKASE